MTFESQLTPEQQTLLKRLLDVFLQENAKLNLTALRTPEACWIGNILDSLALLDIPESSKLEAESSKLIDIGTGGGFPLLPLAIARPDWQCTGVDSIGKKIKADGNIVHTLSLKNVQLKAERSEILGRDTHYREMFDLVTSRAVAPLNILLELCAPFAKVGGYVVLWKSLHIEEELAASAACQKTIHCSMVNAHRYTLPEDFGERQLLIFKKESPISGLYPRAVGEAKRAPL